MKFLTAPCSNCPFLKKNGVRLRRERVKDLCRNALTSQGGSFPCHKTTGVEGYDVPPAQRNAQCAGMILFADKHDGFQNQAVRIAVRLGIFDATRLKREFSKKIFDNEYQMMETAIDAEEETDSDITPCSVTDYGCEAPAGYMDGAYITEGEDNAEFICSECGEPVCGRCSRTVKKKTVCNDCREDA